MDACLLASSRLNRGKNFAQKVLAGWRSCLAWASILLHSPFNPNSDYCSKLNSLSKKKISIQILKNEWQKSLKHNGKYDNHQQHYHHHRHHYYYFDNGCSSGTIFFLLLEQNILTKRGKRQNYLPVFKHGIKNHYPNIFNVIFACFLQ